MNVHLSLTVEPSRWHALLACMAIVGLWADRRSQALLDRAFGSFIKLVMRADRTRKRTSDAVPESRLIRRLDGRLGCEIKMTLDNRLT